MGGGWRRSVEDFGVGLKFDLVVLGARGGELSRGGSNAGLTTPLGWVRG